MSLVKRLSEEKLIEVARKIVNGEYYPLVNEDDYRANALLFFILRDKPMEEIEQIGLVLGEVSSILPRTVNGRPMFSSFLFIHKDDVPFLQKKLKELQGSRGQGGDTYVQ